MESVLHTCDFQDASICGYKQDKNDSMDWMRHSGTTTSASTGPSADHTYGSPVGKGWCLSGCEVAGIVIYIPQLMRSTGYYMYLETSSGQTGSAAKLVSPSQSLGDGLHCLEFFYHMYGSDIGKLTVYERTVVAILLLFHPIHVLIGFGIVTASV